MPAGGKDDLSNQYLDNVIFESIIERYQQTKREKARFELVVEDMKGAVERARRRKDQECGHATGLATARANLDRVIREYKICQNELAAQFYILSESIVAWRKFSLIDGEDAVQDGAVICLEKIDRFDPSKGSAFNYLTTCVLNHFRQLWRSARNYNELKIKYQDFLCSAFESFVARNLRERINQARNNSDSRS